MPKRQSVANGLRKPGQAPEAAPAPAPAPPRRDPQEDGTHPQSNKGKGAEWLSVRVGPEHKKRLQLIKVASGHTVQDLVREALNDLSAKYGYDPIQGPED